LLPTPLAVVDILSQVSYYIGGALGVGSLDGMVSFSILDSSKAHTDPLEVTIPTNLNMLTIIQVVVAPILLTIFFTFIFSQLIAQPPESELQLGSFGVLCDWTTRVWEGWLKFMALFIGVREHEGGLAIGAAGSQPQASQPPPPYDVSMYYYKKYAADHDSGLAHTQFF
jgi:hypothetical protein